MDVILKQDVDNLGYEGEVVAVKNGYARNYLVPKGLAVVATASQRKVHEETMRQRAHKEEKVVAEATGILEKIQNGTIKVGAKVGEAGKIFGSVTNVQVAEAIKTSAGVDVDRKKINIHGDTIKTVGTYEATVSLYKGVSGTFNFEVVED